MVGYIQATTMTQFVDFEAWYLANRASGAIPETSSREACIAQFCTHRVRIEAEEMLRELRVADQNGAQGQGELLLRAEELRAQREDAREVRRTAERAEEKALRALQCFGKAVSVIDGSDRGALRTWLDNIKQAGEVAQASDEAILRFALSNARGNLHQVLYTTYKENGVTPWAEVRKIVANTLLSADEMNYLREQVKALSQLSGESEPGYSQRFWDAARNAWPASDLEGDSTVLQMLLSIFMDSLRDRTTRWYLQVHLPRTIQDAVNLASRSGRAMENEVRKWGQEPMEVGAATSINPPKARKEDASEQLQLVKTLQGEIKSLRKMILTQHKPSPAGEVFACDERPAASTVPPPTYLNVQRQRFAQGGGDRHLYHEQRSKPNIRCFFCEGAHFVRDCTAKREHLAQKRGDLNSQAAAHLGND